MSLTVNQRPSGKNTLTTRLTLRHNWDYGYSNPDPTPFHRKVGPRSVEFYSIHFVASGKVRFGWDGSSVSLSEGDLFCLFPGSVYTYVKDCDVPSTMITWTAFMGELMPSILKHVDLGPERPYRRNAFRDDALAVIKDIQRLLRPQQDHSLQLMSLGFQLIHSIDPNRDQQLPALRRFGLARVRPRIYGASLHGESVRGGPCRLGRRASQSLHPRFYPPIWHLSVPLHAAVDHGESDPPVIRRGNQHHADRFIPGVFGFVHVLPRLYPVFRNDAERIHESEPPIINERIAMNRQCDNEKGSPLATLRQTIRGHPMRDSL